MKSSRPVSAWWRSSKTITTGAVAASRSKNVRHAPNSCSDPAPDSSPSSDSSAGSIQRPLGLVGDVLLEHRGDRRAGRRLVVGLLEAGAAADHLAERPERDALAVGRAAAVVPPDGLDQPVDVLEELPGEARLADAGRPDDADEPRPALAAGRVEQVLELAQLLVAADERRLERLASGRRRRAGRRRGPPARPGPGAALPLRTWSPAGSKTIAPAGGALRSPRRPARSTAARRSGAGWRC